MHECDSGGDVRSCGDIFACKNQIQVLITLTISSNIEAEVVDLCNSADNPTFILRSVGVDFSPVYDYTTCQKSYQVYAAVHCYWELGLVPSNP